MDQITLFGLTIENATLSDASMRIIRDAESGLHRKIYFVNAHCVNVAAMDRDYLSVLQAADLLFADGIGMRIASKWAGLPLIDNVNGTDLFPVICRDAAAAGVRIGLLGARPGIAQQCADNMKQQFPDLKIVWLHDGYFAPNTEADLIAAVNNSGAQILFVAMGVPMQELWINRHADSLRTPVLLGVGALFDFYSGAVPRAPLLMRQWGLEWLFRLMIEPRRLFRRYVLGNPIFLFRASWRRLKGKEALQENPLQKSSLRNNS
ncbi:glycosyltransferase [Nitrosomonas sp. JL21]|uniref:WecB/TagA/CpsF family glycosyltransferase n=1 Tax=Nitrosomonas sp. JL21 TaxID=153949 RepID=UPI00136FDF53|nr:WecB/TagA/CpsF family glycosyltransferase [Nitrosomonas sp. JL21]MBL8496333.1 WecB/TagA/CpsF family glycosyltransferase [Nitrosomonas sp.]MXS79074.1 glycosyltransferase [Nitrosomonas sp. JL21]